MRTLVVDASALGALVFGEPQAEEISQVRARALQVESLSPQNDFMAALESAKKSLKENCSPIIHSWKWPLPVPLGAPQCAP